MAEAILPGSVTGGSGGSGPWEHIGTYTNTSSRLYVDGPSLTTINTYAALAIYLTFLKSYTTQGTSYSDKRNAVFFGNPSLSASLNDNTTYSAGLSHGPYIIRIIRSLGIPPSQTSVINTFWIAVGGDRSSVSSYSLNSNRIIDIQFTQSNETDTATANTLQVDLYGIPSPK